MRKRQINIARELTASNGRKFPSDFVFVAAFKHIQQEAFKFLKKQKIKDITNDEIQWIITVPAIWNDHAKHLMQEWAISAGLVNRNIPNQCKIVYEPDCASLSIQYQMYRQKQKLRSRRKIKKIKYDKRRSKKRMLSYSNEEHKYTENENETEFESSQSDISIHDIDSGISAGCNI